MSVLADLVMDFARGIQAVDSMAPVASNSRTGASYQPGIGPHTEAQTIRLVMAHIADADPRRYGSYKLGVSYADGTRQACDLCLDGPAPWGWAIEVKMLRLMGDNGKLNDNMGSVQSYLSAELRFGRVLDYGVIVPRLQQLYAWSAHELAAPGLLDFVRDGAMTYAWAFEDRSVWRPPKSFILQMTQRALPPERRGRVVS